MRIKIEGLDELRRLLCEARREPAPTDPDDPALGPDAARWTPEDDDG